MRDAHTQHTDTLPESARPPARLVSKSPPAQLAPILAQGQGSSATQAGPHLLGVSFELLPVGTLATKSNGASASADSVFAVGVAPFIDGALSPYVAIGLSPQMIFRVKGDGSTNESAKQLDIRGRLTGRLPLSPRVRTFLRISPAYSIIMLPSPPSSSNAPAPANPQGFLLDGSVGVEVAVLPNLFVVSDVGYQAGFQNSSDGDLHTSYLHLGAGFAIGL